MFKLRTKWMVSSNIKCPPKNGKDVEKIESHGNRAIFGLATNQNKHGDTMGRRKLTLEKHCKGSHFFWGKSPADHTQDVWAFR